MAVSSGAKLGGVVDLNLVFDRLIAKHQHGMFLERRAHRTVGIVVVGDIRHADTANLCADFGMEFDDFHVGFLSVIPQLYHSMYLHHRVRDFCVGVTRTHCWTRITPTAGNRSAHYQAAC